MAKTGRLRDKQGATDIRRWLPKKEEMKSWELQLNREPWLP